MSVCVCVFVFLAALWRLEVNEEKIHMKNTKLTYNKLTLVRGLK